MSSRSGRSFLPLAATLAVMGVSATANVRTIHGLRTGQVSDMLPTGFTPSGWVFSIWSVIYLGLLVHAVSQIVGSRAVMERGARVRVPFLVNAAANIGWIFAWHHLHIGASFALMLVVLGTLVVIHRRLRAERARSRGEALAVDAPFSLYLGWITTATIANLGALLSAKGWYPLGMTMDAWALLSVVLAIGIYVAMALRTRDAVACAVFVWAAFGIWAKPAGISGPVRTAALGGALVVAALVAWIALSERTRRAARVPLT